MRIVYFLIFVVFLFNGCATTPSGKVDKKKTPKPIINKVDLDSDGIKELVQLEGKEITGSDETIIRILNKDKKELDRLTIQDYVRMEFIDLDNNGCKQIVVYIKDKDNYSKLYIYNLKDNRLNEIFSIGSPVGLDSNFKSCIPRIKSGIPIEKLTPNGPTYEVWVWSGYKFIKDHNE